MLSLFLNIWLILMTKTHINEYLCTILVYCCHKRIADYFIVWTHFLMKTDNRIRTYVHLVDYKL